jgi:hypothetical protein
LGFRLPSEEGTTSKVVGKERHVRDVVLGGLFPASHSQNLAFLQLVKNS